MTPRSSRDVLVQSLAELLGFEDGAADVLEHLLSIESGNDLLDYLSQLLGRKDGNVQSFVRDIERFQRGESLAATSSADDVNENDAKTPAILTERTYECTEKKSGNEQRRESNRPTCSEANKRRPLSASATMKPRPKNMPPSFSLEVDAESERSGLASTGAPPEKPPDKSHSLRGTASVTCGCFGNLHKPLTNCLYCGWIACEKEGYGYCPFCGLLVQQVHSSGKEKDKAWEHKECLLRFDRDFAHRTIVLDDQADYFTSNQTWLTEGERAQAEEREAQQQEKMQTRGNAKLDITFIQTQSPHQRP